METENIILKITSKVEFDGDILETLECSVCVDTLKDPHILLKCYHTFCKTCIDEIIAHHFRQAATERKQRPESFPCPDCRAANDVAAPSLPNLVVRNVLDCLKSYAVKQRRFGDRCPHIPAFVSVQSATNCLHCNEKFCSICAVVHIDRMRLEANFLLLSLNKLSNHLRRKVDGVKRQMEPEKYQQADKCLTESAKMLPVLSKRLDASVQSPPRYLQIAQVAETLRIALEVDEKLEITACIIEDRQFNKKDGSDVMSYEEKRFEKLMQQNSLAALGIIANCLPKHFQQFLLENVAFSKSRLKDLMSEAIKIDTAAVVRFLVEYFSYQVDEQEFVGVKSLEVAEFLLEKFPQLAHPSKDIYPRWLKNAISKRQKL